MIGERLSCPRDERDNKAEEEGNRCKGPKTQPTESGVAAFFATLDAATRADCERLDAWMSSVTGAPGVMYGKSIVGYGQSTIRYADGREAPWMLIGFSPRKEALTLYGVLGSAPAALLEKLGKHKTGKGCLYLKRLADADEATLLTLLKTASERR
ncbi:MAG: DUF1801 domain-containing protein [Polyangiaceae bacterium]